jgi:hypothetical protein
MKKIIAASRVKELKPTEPKKYHDGNYNIEDHAIKVHEEPPDYIDKAIQTVFDRYNIEHVGRGHHRYLVRSLGSGHNQMCSLPKEEELLEMIKWFFKLDLRAEILVEKKMECNTCKFFGECVDPDNCDAKLFNKS